MKKKLIFWITGIFLLSFTTYVLINLLTTSAALPTGVIDDYSHLMPTKVKKVEQGHEREQLQQIIKEAYTTGQHISIAGKRHSQGGHTYYKDDIVLDMTTFNNVLQVDKAKKTVIVQSGATWGDIQKAINEDNLALKVTQSQEIFTVGGSLSVNAHGRDIRNHSLASTVNWFTLLTPKGEIITVSRTENAELFPLVLGGYGLYGVILEVELQLTDNELYEIKTDSMSYTDYPSFFKNDILNNPNMKMHIGRLSVAPDHFLTDMYSISYETTNEKLTQEQKKLKEDASVFLPKLALSASRFSDIGKNFFWYSQKKYGEHLVGTYETRNNVMRAESRFMEYESKDNTEVLQEFFVPTGNFVPYVDDVRALLEKEKLNVLNITVRYVSKDNETLLNYGKEDMFALVILINHGKSKEEIEKAQTVIQHWTDITLKYNGSYYLPYYPYQTKEQLNKAYPDAGTFFEKKKQWDDKNVFMNYFYENYGGDKQ